MKMHKGSCHCGAVRFEVEMDTSTGSRCNCTICTKVSMAAGRADPAALKVVAGESELSTYVWGSKVGTRFFCKHCGVHVFGRGHLAELGGDFLTVNLNALDDIDVIDVDLVYWDGRHDNWHAGSRPTPWPLAS